MSCDAVIEEVVVFIHLGHHLSRVAAGSYLLEVKGFF